MKLIIIILCNNVEPCRRKAINLEGEEGYINGVKVVIRVNIVMVMVKKKMQI